MLGELIEKKVIETNLAFLSLIEPELWHSKISKKKIEGTTYI